MAYEYKIDQGSSWANEYKKAGDSKPAMQGKFRLSDEVIEAAKAGKLLTIASWKNETQNGKTYLSHKIGVYEPKEIKEEVLVDDAPF